MQMSFLLWVGIVAQVLLMVVIVFVVVWCAAPWIRSFVSGARVPLIQIVGMRMRGIPVNLMIDAYVALLHQAKPTSMRVLEGCYLAYKHKIHDLNSLMDMLPEYQKGLGSKTSV